MNTAIIRQIVEESKAIPDGMLTFKQWYSEENGVVTMCPVGRHILNHPVLVQTLNVRYDTVRFDHRHRKRWSLCNIRLAKYLDISEDESDFLFSNEGLTRSEFVDKVTSFVRGQLSVKTCCVNECSRMYTTAPDDKACVCDDCKNNMLEMCGL